MHSKSILIENPNRGLEAKRTSTGVWGTNRGSLKFARALNRAVSNLGSIFRNALSPTRKKSDDRGKKEKQNIKSGPFLANVLPNFSSISSRSMNETKSSHNALPASQDSDNTGGKENLPYTLVETHRVSHICNLSSSKLYLFTSESPFQSRVPLNPRFNHRPDQMVC